MISKQHKTKQLVNKAQRFLKIHNNIMVLNSDKTNLTVVMNAENTK